VFTVAPGHPLADLPEPLAIADIQSHRAVSVADSSRNLPPRTAGLLSGQETLTVCDLDAKVMAQRMGLGVGNLPRHTAEHQAHGRTEIQRGGVSHLAHRAQRQSAAMVRETAAGAGLARRSAPH